LARLLATGNWIAEDDPDAAERTVARLSSAVDVIAEHSAIGRSGRLPGTRELMIGDIPSSVVYRVNSADIEILTIIHTSMQWPEAI
jgi:plasmid stabilization system protein ParE